MLFAASFPKYLRLTAGSNYTQIETIFERGSVKLIWIMNLMLGSIQTIQYGGRLNMVRGQEVINKSKTGRGGREGVDQKYYTQ